VSQLFGGGQHIVFDVERGAHDLPDFDRILASAHQVAFGVAIRATQFTQVAPGACSTPACGAESGRTPWALQLLKQGTLRTRPPGQGGKAQGHGEGGEGIAEQLGQQEQGRAGAGWQGRGWIQGWNQNWRGDQGRGNALAEAAGGPINTSIGYCY
jgi:hypothetical protein